MPVSAISLAAHVFDRDSSLTKSRTLEDNALTYSTGQNPQDAALIK